LVTPIAIAIVERTTTHHGRAAREYLVGRREAGIALAGLAEFPGGKLEAGETPEAAAARECLEETGCAVDVVELFAQVRHAYPHGVLELCFFRCRMREATVQPCPPYRWIAALELAALEFPAANASVVARLVQRDAADERPSPA
jgi:mutator protein MutT